MGAEEEEMKTIFRESQSRNSWYGNIGVTMEMNVNEHWGYHGNCYN